MSQRQIVNILDLGSIQVFCWQTPTEILFKSPHKDVSWRNKTTGHTYGPFPSLYECMTHYTWFVANQKKIENVGQVIFVDFIGKKRIVYV